MFHDKYRVSAKAALYNPERTKVLVARYPHGGAGLPGGHMEGNEDPETTVRRELREELGIEVGALARADFFRHRNGKIILGFTGILDESTVFMVDASEIAAAEWVLLDDIRSGVVEIGSYRQFTLDNADVAA